MKKIILLLVSFLSLNLTSCANLNLPNDTAKNSITENAELRGIWLSFYEISDMTRGETEAQFRENARQVLSTLNANNFNAVFYQVRSFGDALYESSVFPSSRYIVENEGDSMEYDPFAIFIEIAKEYNISVHAWVNPFRVTYSTDLNELSDINHAKKIYLENNETESLIVCEKGVFYNPADAEARKLILSGIREIVEKYEVAGVQFDDYFYPETEAINDDNSFNYYKENGGHLSRDEWRKQNVSEFVSSVYSLIKAYDESIVFGISPSASFEKNEKVFADVELWCKEDGFVDYIMPQIYFGFENENMPFAKTANKWNELEKAENVVLYIGLSPYKTGEVDENAGSGKNEWIENNNILSRQYKFLKENVNFDGFCLFSYSYCYGENASLNAKAELEVLTSMV